jgi:hypothetical protein
MIGVVAVGLVCFKAEARLRLLTNGSLARGALDSKSYHGRTPYDILQKEFESGKGVKISEVNGWYVGRCFFSDSPMQPVASLLLFSQPGSSATSILSLSSKSGPRFQSSLLKTAIPLIDSEAPANTFDALSSEQIAQVRHTARGKWSSNSFAVEESASLLFDGLRTFDTEARTYELRRGEKYLYLRLSCAEPGFCLNDRGSGTGYKLINNEGESTTACYYFKRVLTHDPQQGAKLRHSP